ncbi:ABC transporter ATP-binding protein [Rhizobium tubonense]|uniref:ABC transporter n=1 Tax=Rhizobium tubonense TaxID=484088 RepID=A0A2W4F260_9HYPH|nr:sn-glycerol-3-phosphate ABC transporter ATP-binding protein UgpC [Rhizobium tubonense]PZM15930.1 ABC transporter [Rhizobium tubonense]
MANVDISQLRKSYGHEEVIHGVDLSIKDGEFVSLIGASGCGKSTLLRMVAGLESVTSGTISLNGRTINDVAPKNRDIAMVFQNYALYPHLTVAENMGFSLKLRKVPPAQIRSEVESTAELLGLKPYLERYPKALSGGQRQRVAMGRAIVRKPQVFLFDEPLSNLDAKLRVQMRIEIKSLQRRLGTTSIYVTHDQMEAMTMSDRVVILNGGRVEQVGAPLDVYDNPANLFVATFIGSPAMNLLDGILVRDGDRAVAQIDGVEITVSASTAAPSGTRIVLGVRPEHLMVDAGNQGEGCLRFQVSLVEPTGAESHIYGRCGYTDMIVALSGRSLLSAGDTVQLSANKEQLHLFEKETGRRI